MIARETEKKDTDLVKIKHSLACGQCARPHAHRNVKMQKQRVAVPEKQTKIIKNIPESHVASIG